MFNFLRKLDRTTVLFILIVSLALFYVNGGFENFQSFKYYNGYGARLGGFAGFAHPYYGHSPGCTHGGYGLPEKSEI